MPDFEKIGLDSDILQAIDALGFVEPTPIQQETIPYILGSEEDLIALAQTGTGKTAAFGLPLIQKIDIESKDTQALVLCPTRELCIQIAKDISQYSKQKKKLKTVAIYGGASIEGQIKAVKRGTQIIVGTPGRVLDLLNKNVIDLEKIQWLVLDEADEMLNMGFKESLDAILETTPVGKQTLLFSATMPGEVKSIAKRYMDSPKEISMSKQNNTAENVDHHYYIAGMRDKYEAVKRIADLNPDIYGIIFCRTRAETKDIADKLISDGYNADALHGDLSQVQRDVVMNRFRTRHLQILVATDVAARGLDVNELTHIINYNLPDDLDVYIHRSGRTGRAGNSGISIVLVSKKDIGKLMQLERKIKRKFERKMIPGGKDIVESQLMNMVSRIKDINPENYDLDSLINKAAKNLGDMNRDELLKRFIALEFDKFIEYYKDSKDLNVNGSIKEDRQESRNGRRNERNERNESRGKRGKNISYSMFRINIGKKNNLSVKHVLQMINMHLPKKNIEIGEINIMKRQTQFEIDARFSKDFKKSFKGLMFDNIYLELERVN